MNKPLLKAAFVVLIAIALPPLLPAAASAANILWDGTGTSWNVAGNWSLFSNATTPNPAAKPGASDTAIFNIEIVNTPQSVNLNAAQAALGLAFNSTGPVSIQTGTGTNALALGSGGIAVNPGAGINTITSALSLSAPQTWTNNSGSLLTVSGGVTHGGNSLTIAGSGNTAINGALDAGNLVLTKNGAGTLSLNAANNSNFSTDLLINVGNVSLGNAGALPGLAESDLTFGPGSTGAFTLNGHSVRVYEFSTNATPGAPVVQNANATPAMLTVGKPFVPFTFAGVLRDGVGAGSLGLTVQGPLTLSGNNTYTGLTEVISGLTLQSATALGSTDGGTVLNSGSGLDLNGQTIGGETLTIASNSQLSNTSVTPASWAGNITSIGGVDVFNVLGSGDIALSGGISAPGIDPIFLRKLNSNTLELTGTTNNSSLALRATQGVVRLAKTSSAIVHAVGSDVLVEGGTVQLAGTGGDQIGGSVFLTGGTFDMNGRNETINGLTLNGSGIGGVGALVNSASGDSVLTLSSGGMHIESFTRIGVTQSGASLTLDATFSPSVSDVQKVGQGTLILTRSNVSFGGDIFLTAGTIAVGSTNALGSGGLVFEGGAPCAEGAPRTITRPMTVSSTGVITGDVDLTLFGVIGGAAGLTKSGAGRLTLTAANTYAGLTTVDGGTLAVNGSIVGAATVNAAMLAGTGVIGGDVTLNAGGTLAPGASAGEITVGSLAMTAGATLAIELGGLLAGSQHDQVESAGTLALDGTLAVLLIGGFTPSAGQSFDLLNGGALTGSFDTISLPSLAAGLAWNTSQLYTTGVLAVTPAPTFTADFDEDGDVDAADLTRWRTNFGIGTTHMTGDADADGDADGEDFLAWQRQLGSTSSVPSTASVPEPSTLTLTLLLAAFVLAALSLRERGRG